MDIWVPLNEKEKNINKKVIKIRREDGNGEFEEREREFFFKIFLLVSFSDSRKFDRRNSSG